MIKIENVEVLGLEAAIRGMRNPMNSWDKSDSGKRADNMLGTCESNNHSDFHVGKKDYELMLKLANGGSVHAKFRRMIVVYVDITAPLYWWKEFDTYKVGTVANSCSTMHKIHDKEFVLDDFSTEHLCVDAKDLMKGLIRSLNVYRLNYEQSGHEKHWWWQMIQLLPSSYNQKRTIMLNYEVLSNIYDSRKNHKLDEWQYFCQWIRKDLPYSDLISY